MQHNQRMIILTANLLYKHREAFNSNFSPFHWKFIVFEMQFDSWVAFFVASSKVYVQYFKQTIFSLNCVTLLLWAAPVIFECTSDIIQICNMAKN